MRRAEQIITGSRTEILASNGKRCAKSRIYSISKGRDKGRFPYYSRKLRPDFRKRKEVRPTGAERRGKKDGEGLKSRTESAGCGGTRIWYNADGNRKERRISAE